MKDLATIESRPNLDGRNMVMMLAPNKQAPPAGTEKDARERDAEEPSREPSATPL